MLVNIWHTPSVHDCEGCTFQSRIFANLGHQGWPDLCIYIQYDIILYFTVTESVWKIGGTAMFLTCEKFLKYRVTQYWIL